MGQSKRPQAFSNHPHDVHVPGVWVHESFVAAADDDLHLFAAGHEGDVMPFSFLDAALAHDITLTPQFCRCSYEKTADYHSRAS